jgi:hypothetical protein
MQMITHYLKDLLADFDCVTVPGLGGFIMHSSPSKLNQGKNILYPPARIPTFNLLLNHDDGLLISSVSRHEHITYAQAAGKVADFVDMLKKELEKEAKYKLEGIGDFIYTPERIILFRQDEQLNFANPSYGLTTIRLTRQPVLSKPSWHAVKPSDRKPQRVSARKPASVKWTLSLALPLVMFLLYGIIFPASFQEVYTDTANLANYFFSPLKNDKPLAVADEPAFELIEQAPDTETITEKSPEPAMSPEPLTAGSKDELPAKELSPKYYIIGGCFESGENAAQFMAELSGKGYDAEKAGTNKSGHVRISYRSFSDKKAALEYLSRIREEENQSAWLLKY